VVRVTIRHYEGVSKHTYENATSFDYSAGEVLKIIDSGKTIAVYAVGSWNEASLVEPVEVVKFTGEQPTPLQEVS
jgi:hypothetical protein